jgi:hypothetical protein
MMKREFHLPEQDVIYLNGLGLPWEAVNDRGMQWVIIHHYPLPAGYNISEVSVAIKIQTGYPRAALDMAYFFPALFRLDSKTINATTVQPIADKQYQRWSRHRTGQNPWREDIDDLSTHMALVSFWFEQEFIKQPNGIAA